MVTRIYWKVGNVAELLGRHTSLIRYWCKAFDIKPRRSQRGQRMFNEKELKKIRRISELYATGFYSIKGIKEILEGRLYPFV